MSSPTPQPAAEEGEPGEDAAEEEDFPEGDPDSEAEVAGMLAQPAFPGSTVRIGYHGTNSAAALSIMATGFRCSADGMLGEGVYWSDDVAKARAYTNDGTILRVQVKVGRVKRIDRQGHPLQKTWHLTHHTAWLPAQADLPAAQRMVPSGLSENCTHNPSRLRVVGLSTNSGESWQTVQVGAGAPVAAIDPEPTCACPQIGCTCSLPAVGRRLSPQQCIGATFVAAGVVLIVIGSLQVSVDNGEPKHCVDDYSWLDSDGDSCSAYAYICSSEYDSSEAVRHERAGRLAVDGVSANDACCACKKTDCASGSTLGCGSFWSSFPAGGLCVWTGVVCIAFGVALGAGRILSGNRAHDMQALIATAVGLPVTLGLAMWLYSLAATEPQDLDELETFGVWLLCLLVCFSPFILRQIQLAAQKWWQQQSNDGKLAAVLVLLFWAAFLPLFFFLVLELATIEDD